MKSGLLSILLLIFSWALSGCERNIPQQEREGAISQMVNSKARPSPEVIYLSRDAGMTWIPYANGIPVDATVSCFLIKGEMVYATTDNHGIYAIQQGGTDWLRLGQNLPADIDINAITGMGEMLIIGTNKHGILISHDNGQTFTSANTIIHSPLRCLISRGTFLLAGGDDGIYKSIDKGKTWSKIYNGVQVNGFSPMNNKLYASVMNGVMVTPDEGATWNYVYEPLTTHDVSNDGEYVYAMTLGGGLLRSGNDGVTWENINTGLGPLNLYTFEVKAVHGKLFAAQWHGIYLSENGGKSWNMLRDGLPDSTAFTTLETFDMNLIAGIGLRKNVKAPRNQD